MAVRVLEDFAVDDGHDSSVQEGTNEPDVGSFAAASKDIGGEPHGREGEDEQQHALKESEQEPLGEDLDVEMLVSNSFTIQNGVVKHHLFGMFMVIASE